MESFFIVLMILIAVVSVIGIVSYTQRIKVRHFLHTKRELIIGKLIWSEIIHEGAPQTGNQNKRISVADVSGLLSLNESVRASGWWPYRSRGVISYVWLRHIDGSIHLYVGVSEASYGDGSAIKVAANAIKAKAVRQDSPPDVPVTAYAVAKRGRSLPTAARDIIEGSGSLADSISSAMKNMPARETAAVVLTMEAVYNGEVKRLTANIVEEASMYSGQASMFGGIAQSAGIMSNKAMRTSIAATVSMNEPHIASGLLNAATSGIPSFGWQTSFKSYSGSHSNSEMSERLAGGEIVLPPFVWLNPRWYIQANIRARRKEAGSEENVGGHTSSPSSTQIVYLHPLALFEAVSFPERFSSNGVDVHQDMTLSRGLPSSMIEVEHQSYWGRSGTDQLVYQDLADMHYSMYTAGAPGTGKTNFLQVIFAGVVKACIDHAAGLQITPIWGETKGEGAEDSWLIAKAHPNAIFVDTHNPLSTHRLALEGPRMSDGATVNQIKDNITNLVSGMQCAWGDGIRSASRELLDLPLRIAMLLTPSQIKFLELDGMVNAQRPNIIDLAFYILGGDNRIQPGAKLLTIQDDSIKTGEAYNDETLKALCDAIGAMSRFLDPKTRKNFETNISSPLNKLSDLRNARLAWEPNERTDAYIADIPTRFAPVVINMGPYRKPDGNYSSIQQSISKRLLLMTNYLIWDTIKSNCSGWQAQGKRINLFFDEVADIASDSQSDDVMNVLADALKEGRSRGTAYYVGCQSPAQMPYQARHSVLGSRSKFWFGLHEGEDLNLAVDDLSSGDRNDRPYTQENIRRIPDGTCVGIMKRQSTVTPAFTLKVPYASKWASVLLQPGVTVEEAVIEYSEWEDRQAFAKAN